MAKYSRFGKNAWKIKALNCAVMLAAVTVIGIMLYFGYKIVQPVKSQAAMPFDEENTESARILMSVTAREGLNVRTKPSTEGDIILVLKYEEKVEVLSTSSDQWVYIRCIERNGEEGYASSKYLTLAEGNDIGAGVDAGTVTDDLNSEEPEDTKEDEKEYVKYKEEQGRIKDWIKKHGGKLAIAGVIVLLLVSLAIFISKNSNSGKIIFGGALLIVGGLVFWGGWTGVWSGLMGHLSFTQSQMTVGCCCLIALLVILVLLSHTDTDAEEIPKLIRSLYSTAFYGLLIVAMFPDGASWGRLGEFWGNISFVRSCVEFCWGAFILFSVLTVGALPILLVIVLCGILCGLPYRFVDGNEEDIFNHAKNALVTVGVTGFVFLFLWFWNCSFLDVLRIFGLYFFIGSWMISQYNIFAPAPFELKEKDDVTQWRSSGGYSIGTGSSLSGYSSGTSSSLGSTGGGSWFDGTSPTLTDGDHASLDMLQNMMDQHFSDGM